MKKEGVSFDVKNASGFIQFDCDKHFEFRQADPLFVIRIKKEIILI